MNWVKRTLLRLLVPELRALKYAGVPLRDPALAEMFGTTPTSAGVHVDENNAVSLSSYFTGIRLISSAIGQVGFECMQVAKNGGIERNDDHISNFFFDVAPNQNETPISLTSLLQFDSIGWGNAYAEIKRDENTNIPVALNRLKPDQMTVEWDENGDGTKVYKFKKQFAGEKDRRFAPADIVHIPGYLYDGLRGYSLASIARQSLAIGIATESFGASFFGNNSVPGGIVTTPKELDNKAKMRLERDIEDRLNGPLRARRLMILDEDMKWIQTTVNAEDSQFIETRQFQVLEMCRWLRIPPHMLYQIDIATIGSIEEQGLNFISHTLGPWVEAWCQELKLKLLNTREQKKCFFRFKNNGQKLINTDTAKRFENYAKGRNSLSIFSINDILRAEGRPLIDDAAIGNTLIAPSTMKNLGTADPTTPIQPAVIQQTLQIINSFETPIDSATATKICYATMPTASDDFINSLVKTIKNNTLKEPEKPKGMVAA